MTRAASGRSRGRGWPLLGGHRPPPPPPPRPPRHPRQPGASSTSGCACSRRWPRRSPSTATPTSPPPTSASGPTSPPAPSTSTSATSGTACSPPTWRPPTASATEIEAACAASGDEPATGESDALAIGIERCPLLLRRRARASAGCSAPKRHSRRAPSAPLAASSSPASPRCCAAPRGADDSPQPAGLDERLIDATLTFVNTRLSADDAERLPELTPELVAILDHPRVAA